MSDFLAALGLLLVFEGIMLALFSDRLAWLLEQLQETPREVLRIAGLVAAVIGILVIWLVRG